jgi:hypothetical protein
LLLFGDLFSPGAGPRQNQREVKIVVDQHYQTGTTSVEITLNVHSIHEEEDDSYKPMITAYKQKRLITNTTLTH